MLSPPAAQAPEPAVEPKIRYPLQAEPQQPPLYALDESDTPVLRALAALFSDPSEEQLYIFGSFIRRVVTTIDNLPRSKVAARLAPMTRAPGQFKASRNGEAFTIASDNLCGTRNT